MLRRASPSGPLDVTPLERLPAAPTAPAPDLVVVRAPPDRPLVEVIGPVRAMWRSTSVLAIVCAVTGGGEEFLESLERDLDDFVCCPFTDIDLLPRVRRLLPGSVTARSARAALVGDIQLDLLVGESPAFLRAIALIPRVAASSATVLIGGETGVGKGLFARAIHYNGVRRSRPFIPVNCSAVPDHLFENELFGHVKGAYTDASTAERGLLEEAEGGTLFLDEVDTLSLVSQAKLLRFLQDGEYRPLGTAKTRVADVRVIAGTNADLRERVRSQLFRADLFHRLNVLAIDVPPLRERLTDVALLARHFLARYAAQYGRPQMRLARATLPKLLRYDWPGNVRELEALLHRAVVVAGSDVIEPHDVELPGPGSRTSRGGCPSAPKDRAMGEFERGYLASLLAEHHGNVSRAAIAAGRDRRSFQRLLHKHGLARVGFDGDR